MPAWGRRAGLTASLTGGLLAALLAGCSGAAPTAPPTTAPTTAPTTVATAPSQLVFGQTFTWPDGTKVVVLPPVRDPAGPALVDLQLRITAGAADVVLPADLQVMLSAAGQALAPRTPLPSGTLPAGTARTASLTFAAPAGAGGWTATVTLRGAPPTVTFGQDI